MTMYKVDFKSIAWETPAQGVRFKAHKDEGKQLRFVEFYREFVEVDWCQRGHIGYVLEGELEIDFSGQLISFSKGDGVFIPAGELHQHKARAITDVAKVILVEEP
ncbi:MAG: cupin domain-containing protein [Desulfomonile tiedjei]|nr:cupin domain-containing protein [Desulfomonile tiedjei]